MINASHAWSIGRLPGLFAHYFVFVSSDVVVADADLDDRDTLLVATTESPFPVLFSLPVSSSSSSETEDPAETFSPEWNL